MKEWKGERSDHGMAGVSFGGDGEGQDQDGAQCSSGLIGVSHTSHALHVSFFNLFFLFASTM